MLQRVQVPGSEEAVRGLSGQGEGVICPLCGDIHLYSKPSPTGRVGAFVFGSSSQLDADRPVGLVFAIINIFIRTILAAAACRRPSG